MPWKKALLNKKKTIFEAIKNLEETTEQIVLVIDDRGNFVGTLTDGDIRSGIIKGVKLNTPIEKLMNQNPITIKSKIADEVAFEMMRKNSIIHLPLINKKKNYWFV